MMKITLMLLVLTTVLSSNVTAHAIKNTNSCHFVPKNNLYIPVQLGLIDGISEATFKKIISTVSAIYRPTIKTQGGTLEVQALWTDGTVNASSHREGNTWVVTMYGGLARHVNVTEDLFTLVLCHEFGHHLGGFPKILDGTSWASNEGEADYFAGLKCFRQVFENADNSTAVSKMTIPPSVKNKCSLQHKTQNEIDLCERESMASWSLATFIWNLTQDSTEPKPNLEAPDPSVVTETDDYYPSSQCRMDTYINGALCGISAHESIGKDAITGVCAKEKGDQVGVRPECWYHPETKLDF